jgi:hypothetical protein
LLICNLQNLISPCLTMTYFIYQDQSERGFLVSGWGGEIFDRNAYLVLTLFHK